MSFWNLNDNTEQLNTTGTFETGGGDMEPIPAKTQVKAVIDEAKLDDYEGDQYISLRWSILAPEEYKNRKVFQKVRVFESDPKKQDKAKRMLAAIAANAGGGLLQEADPTSGMALQKHLLMKPMVIMLQVWAMEQDDGTTRKGNWISAVSPLNNQAAPQQQAASPQPTATPAAADDFDGGF